MQRLKSLVYPVHLRSGSSAVNPVLGLYYFRGRYQLATTDALYSDGTRYRPVVAAFSHLKRNLPRINDVLVLGAGLGSAVQVGYSMGFRPRFTLVDIDETVLGWIKELLPPEQLQNVTTACEDASAFFESRPALYDLIIIDLFIGREVPAFATENAFIGQCKAHLSPGGFLVMNYMVRQHENADGIKGLLEKFFGGVKEIGFGLNRVFVCML